MIDHTTRFCYGCLALYVVDSLGSSHRARRGGLLRFIEVIFTDCRLQSSITEAYRDHNSVQNGVAFCGSTLFSFTQGRAAPLETNESASGSLR